MARSRPHHDSRAGSKDFNTTPQSKKSVRPPPKKVEGIVDIDETTGSRKKKTTVSKSAEKIVQPVVNSSANKSPASSKSKPDKAATKISEKGDDKNQERNSQPRFLNLEKYAADRRAENAQADTDDDSEEDGPSQEDINAEVTKRSAKMSDQIAALLKTTQETWLQAQRVADDFLGFIAYVGDEKDTNDARVKFERVRKRRIISESVEWPAAKRAKEGDSEK